MKNKSIQTTLGLVLLIALVSGLTQPAGAHFKISQLASPTDNDRIDSPISSIPPTIPAEELSDVVEPLNTYEQVIQNGEYPAQLAGHTGNIVPSRYGPQRNDPAEGIPKHAYSPFDERNNREHPCPPGGCDFTPGQVNVKLAPFITVTKTGPLGPKTDSGGLNQTLQNQNVLRLEPLFPKAQAPAFREMVDGPQGEQMPKPDLTRWYRAVLVESANVLATVKSLNQDPDVLYAEPDFLRKPTGDFSFSDIVKMSVSIDRIPSASKLNSPSQLPGPGSDPLYNQQWHLDATNVPQAWAYLESQGLPPGGNRDIVVAVIDTGVDYNHPDLAANMWINAPEFVGTTGVDDDGNGYVDDIYGADMVYPDGDPIDDHGHGTHVAGIIAAQANNGIGGVGLAYNAQIMALKAAQYSGVLSTSDIAEAIYYAIEKGADVINMSFGSYAHSQLEEDALTIAFGQAVLVAAAGNDGISNDHRRACFWGYPLYPASNPWVLGVMASTPGNGFAFFSNWDCYPKDTWEYELMAPGVDVWSTLPMEQYAAWDGTSMSTSVVSGIAALARTKWNDKNVYSSRFIMGQIASNLSGGIDGVADAYSALTIPPKPELSYLEHWVFDTTDQDGNNDNDGIVDSGETIDLAITIRNYWGKADPVTVTLEAWAEGAVFPDPYVTMITDTVSYGAIGSFNQDDNGLIYDDDGLVIGIRHPFRFFVDPSTPNDHIIPFHLHMIAENGYDSDDPNSPYTFDSYFYVFVQKGFHLPSIISSDMILNNENYWILPGSVLIESGVTVTVTEGTQLQFWSIADYSSALFLQVEGNLIVLGSENDPVEMYPDPLLPGYPIEIYQDSSPSNTANVELHYTKIMNPRLQATDGASAPSGLTLIDHCYFSQILKGCIYNNGEPTYGGEMCSGSNPVVRSNLITETIFDDIGWYYMGTNERVLYLQTEDQIQNSLFDSTLVRTPENWQNGQNNVFLKGYRIINQVTYRTTLGDFNNTDGSIGFGCLGCEAEYGRANNQLRNNSFLSVWWNPDYWIQVKAPSGQDWSYYITDNYWGTESSSLIEEAIHDYSDDFNLARYIYSPVTTTPLEDTYPFVLDVNISTSSDTDATIVGAETITFTVTFNRDMDINLNPSVTFGPAVPFTDYSLTGDWVNSQVWTGEFQITPVTGDGYQLIRIANARAANDPWLIIGDDSERFRFEIITSGTEAMNLQATGGEGFIDLMWSQDDFDLLAGYNLYRSTSQGGTYTRLNPTIIPPDVHTWRDTDVVPGQPYYYYFTIVETDMSESDPSNIATATPIDTIPPVIDHTPVTDAPPGLSVTLVADVTDNVGVQSVNLFYRQIGDTLYSSISMVHTTGDRFSATIEGSLITSPGIEYYIEASDGISSVRSGRPEFPHQVSVIDKPVVTLISPNHGPANGGTAVTISGSNFKEGASVTFGGAVASDVSILSSTQITCTTPAHFPEVVDVTVTNPDSQSDTLLRSFTYESDTASMSVPDTGGGQHAIVQVPVNLSVQGLAAASYTVSFDDSVLNALGASNGNLTPGWSMATNTSTPGQIRVSMASPGGTVTSSGVLAYIEFDVVGSPGENSALSLSDVLLNDGAIPVQTADGSFSVDLVYEVSGTINFWNGGVVSDTLMILQGDRIYIGMSGSDGSYSVGGAAAGDYTLYPSKSNDSNGISAYDASLALQHDAGLITLTGHAAIAADVNKSGAINSMDAFYILQKAVDLIVLPFPGAGVVWDFAPSSRTYTDLSSDLTGQDFSAVLLGDSSGNWMPGSQAGESFSLNAPQEYSATLSLPELDVLPGDVITIPLELELIQGLVYAADINITYDPTVVTPTQVLAGDLTSGWSIASNLNTPGLIRVAMAGSTPLTVNGELVRLNFVAADNAGLETDLSLIRGELNEGAIPADLQSGHVYIAYPVHSDFSATPTSGPAPLFVTFTNLSTGDYTNILWEFGDGITSTLSSPSYTYSTPGLYSVSLTVSGSGGSQTLNRTEYIDVNTLSIKGKVKFWVDNVGVPNVNLPLSGSQVYNSTSDLTGIYTITGILAGDYILVPEKLDDTNGITAYDASLVLQHSAGLITLSGHQATAADVNKNGSIASMDASYILQNAVNLIPLPFPGADKVWEFDPSQYLYDDLDIDLLDQDFTAILLGDPSGSWTYSSPTMPSSDIAYFPNISATLSLPQLTVQPSEIFTVPMELDLTQGDIYAADIVLSYDSIVVNPTQVSLGSLLNSWNIASNLSTPGLIRVAIAGSTPLITSGEILQFSFKASEVSGLETDLLLSLGDLNEGTIPAELKSGHLSITGTYTSTLFFPVIYKN